MPFMKKFNLREVLSSKSITERITNKLAKTYKKHDQLVFMSACLLHLVAFASVSCPLGQKVKKHNKFSNIEYDALTLHVAAQSRNQHSTLVALLTEAPSRFTQDSIIKINFFTKLRNVLKSNTETTETKVCGPLTIGDKAKE